MQALISRFVSFLIGQQIVKEGDREIYEFGFWSAFLFLLNFLCSLILIGSLGKWYLGSIFLLLFIVIRSYAGGYHSKSPWTCFVISQICIVAGIILCGYAANYAAAGNSIKCFVLYLLMSIIILYFSPRQSPENPLTENDKKKYRNRLIAIYTVLSAGCLISLSIGRYTLLAVMLVLDGILFCSFLADVIVNILSSRENY